MGVGFLQNAIGVDDLTAVFETLCAIDQVFGVEEEGAEVGGLGCCHGIYSFL
jgi:hypothetical protein